MPVRAKAKPIVASSPEYRVVKPIAIIAAMVMSEKRTRYRVFAYWRTRRSGLYPIRNPEMIAEKRIPVPDAESQLSRKIAGSGVGLATTGGTRSERLCRFAIGIFGADT